jgi:hypothetical protein
MAGLFFTGEHTWTLDKSRLTFPKAFKRGETSCELPESGLFLTFCAVLFSFREG